MKSDYAAPEYVFTFPEPKFIATDIPSFSALTLLVGRQDRVHAAYKNPFQLFAYRLKAFPYLIPSIGPGADPGVQAVRPAGDRKSSTRQ